MSAGLGVLPQWGDDKSDPSVTECELVIDAEKFDSSDWSSWSLCQYR
jgi:hypothetical protein